MEEILQKIDKKISELLGDFIFYTFIIFSVAVSHIFYFITKRR